MDLDISPPPLLEDTDRNRETTLTLDPGTLALRRLVSCTVPQDELPSLIITIVSNVKAANIVESLEGGDAQIFIDIMDQVR
jgi:hypothetical protein